MTLMLKLCRIYAPCKALTQLVDGILDLIDLPTAELTSVVNLDGDSSGAEEEVVYQAPASASAAPLEVKEEIKEEPEEPEPSLCGSPSLTQTPDEVRSLPSPRSPKREPKEPTSGSAGPSPAPPLPLRGSITGHAAPAKAPGFPPNLYKPVGRHSDIRYRNVVPRPQTDLMVYDQWGQCQFTWQTPCQISPRSDTVRPYRFPRRTAQMH